ncbi:hypothetical protein BRADI_4g28347v3 [Brachypodium distachyon]|uniref:Uncharacterized protein n=1 Tax=Brachypodium distachyon TaxID=15368 RepID=A0A2K2CQW6_BRADI|nr:hypothetical protein BRADI_4g28347v3 [Brachypodium distachyon]
MDLGSIHPHSFYRPVVQICFLSPGSFWWLRKKKSVNLVFMISFLALWLWDFRDYDEGCFCRNETIHFLLVSAMPQPLSSRFPMTDKFLTFPSIKNEHKHMYLRFHSVFTCGEPHGHLDMFQRASMFKGLPV